MNLTCNPPLLEYGAWRPILSDEPLQQARRRLHSIIEYFLNTPPTPDPSLAQGNAGIALFLFYCLQEDSLFDRYPRLGLTTEDYLSAVMAHYAQTSMALSFFGGLTGLAWTLNHCYNNDQPSVFDCTDVDEILINCLMSDTTESLPIDLINGLVGFGVYALARPKHRALILLNLIFIHITHRITKHASYDLGIAHGMAGMVALLRAALIKHPELKPKYFYLLEKLKSRANARLLNTKHISPFSNSNGHSAANSRLAWCHGELAIATALGIPILGGGESAINEEAVQLAILSTQRNFENSGVVDGGFCHGAAGIAHIYNRWFQATRQEVFFRRSNYWFAKLLDLPYQQDGIAGFASCDVEENKVPRYIKDSGFLTGVAGIGLALLAATASTYPSWDQTLLISC